MVVQPIRTYYAHSAENLPESHWQTLNSHFSSMKEMASTFAFFMQILLQ